MYLTKERSLVLLVACKYPIFTALVIEEAVLSLGHVLRTSSKDKVAIV